MGAATASTQAYTAKPVRSILPVATSSTSDTLGRMIARQLDERLGQQIVINNQPGAGGNIGVPVAPGVSENTAIRRNPHPAQCHGYGPSG